MTAGAPSPPLLAGVTQHKPRLPLLPDPAQAGLPERLRLAARELGLERVGFAPVARFDGAADRLQAWLDRGYHGEMGYLAGPADRADPRALLEQARTLIAVALPYASRELEPPGGALRGYVARYARGADYHDVLRHKLRALADRLAEMLGRVVLARACVDTAPLLEREAAVRAGLGFSAKSTLTIVPGLGTTLLIGVLLVDVEIDPSPPVAPRCGSCRACLDACPTGAFVDAHVLDARRCISYLTIEHRGAIPHELRPRLGNMVFGCDVCQDVCPFNASVVPRPVAPELHARAELSAPDLIGLLELGAASYRKLVRKSALRRATREQLARNAAVALGNSGDARAVPALARAAEQHRSALVRGHAAWALGRLGGDAARSTLERLATSDPDDFVRVEAAEALRST